MAENVDLPGGCLTRRLDSARSFDIWPAFTPELNPELPAFDLDGSGRLSPPLVSLPFDHTTDPRGHMVSMQTRCVFALPSRSAHTVSQMLGSQQDWCAGCCARAAPTLRRAITVRPPCTGHTRGTAACTTSGCAGQPPRELHLLRCKLLYAPSRLLSLWSLHSCKAHRHVSGPGPLCSSTFTRPACTVFLHAVPS
jgi:hypothetical protein